jgi:ring-1,2-phenylacetyl-CoA epoxidase subunit PaaC
MFVASPAEQDAVARGIAPDPASLAAGWSSRVDEVLQEATLKKPADVPYAWHGKRGQHGEHLSRLLAEMQVMQRTYPGAQW